MHVNKNVQIFFFFLNNVVLLNFMTQINAFKRQEHVKKWPMLFRFNRQHEVQKKNSIWTLKTRCMKPARTKSCDFYFLNFIATKWLQTATDCYFMEPLIEKGGGDFFKPTLL